MILGIIADDVTGSSAMAGMFDNDLDIRIYLNNKIESNPDIAFLDTNSRFDCWDDAYEKVYNSTKYLMTKNPNQLLKKICSTFRGNIGAELDGFLDATEKNFVLVVAGYPDNGRTTIDGVHYVNGVELRNSSLSKDPVNPMTESNLVEILKKQTKRKVGLLDYKILDKPLEEIHTYIEKQKKSINYLICDCRDNRDLATISKIIEDHNIVSSSIGLGKYINIKADSSHKNIHNQLNTTKTLVVSGSLTPTTKEQIEYSIKNGVTGFEIDPIDYFYKKLSYKTLVSQIIKKLRNNNPVIIYTSNKETDINNMKSISYKNGLNDADIAKAVSGLISNIVYEVNKEVCIDKFVIGGGDTSESVLRKLGIESLISYKQLSEGVSANYTEEKYPRSIILKSGNFGSKDIYIKSIYDL